MSTTIKIGYLPKNSLQYSKKQDEYWFLFGGRENLLSCSKDHGLEVVYDQVYRQMYFNHGCNVIYSHHFYNREGSWFEANGYKILGFFK